MRFNSDSGLVAVRFHSGKIYVHSGMTPDIWGLWTGDWSAGKYYNQIIRKQSSRFPIVAIR